MSRTKAPRATATKRMSEGGKVTERIYKQGLADPRGGVERAVGLANRAVQVDRKAPVRRYDDDPATMAKNRAAVKKR